MIDSTSPEVRDAELLEAAVREAGELALSYFGRSPEWSRKADGSRVSEADLAVDAALRDRLISVRPGYGWLSEESEDSEERLARDRVWVVDPIDGTTAFLEEREEWTIAAALVTGGRPVLAAVFNPVSGEFFSARAGHGTLLNGARVRVSARASLAGCRLAASPGLFRRKIWAEPWPEVNAQWVNSIAYRLALVAAGKYDGTLSLSPKHDWDLAAAELLVQEAGGRISTHAGGGFTYNARCPIQTSVIAAGPSLYPELLRRSRSARF
ncbi:MAG: 3'(2'),5'-bisphosphate nucleotidase CysQ [Methyloligellaceae bacterium]